MGVVKCTDVKQSNSTYKTTFKIEQNVGLKTRCDSKDQIYEKTRNLLIQHHANKIIADVYMRLNRSNYLTIQDAFKSIDSLIFQIGSNVPNGRLREQATSYSANLTFEIFETDLLKKYEFMVVSWLGVYYLINIHIFFIYIYIYIYMYI